MAQAVFLVAKGLITVFGVSSYAGIGAAIIAAKAFVYIGGQFLLNKAISALTKRPKRGSPGYEINFSGTIEPRRIIGGKVKVGGMHNIPPITTGSKGKYGHADIVLAGHEVHDIPNVYFDQDLIADGNISAVTGTQNDGLVTGTKYANKAWIRRYLGTSNQAADRILRAAYPDAFNASFRLRGNAHVAVQCEFDPKIYNGFPTITAEVEGQKLYDPRLDSTKSGGSGSHREDDPDTWEWDNDIGSNPALFLRHYLVNEVGFSHEEMIDSMIMTAANTCDAQVDIPGGTQCRWRFNQALIATDHWEDNLRLIVDSMRGHAAYVDGKWHIWAGEWQTPDVTINQGDWVSSMVVQASANRDERWNFVRGWYVDPDRNWQRVECYPRRSSVYEAEDGNERIAVEVEMPYVASDTGTKHAEYEAQRHAEFILRQSRNQIKVTGMMRPEFAKLIPGNTVFVNDSTYGWNNKTFRIIAVEAGIGTEDGVSVALLEDSAAAWSDLAEEDYNEESAPFQLEGGATIPELTEDPVITIGPNTISINASSAVPSHQPPNTEYAVIEHTSNFPPSAGQEVWRGFNPVAVVLRSDATTKFYWMRANVNTYVSEYIPNTLGIAVAPMSYGPAGLAFSKQPASLTRQGNASTDPLVADLIPGGPTVPSNYIEWAGANGTVTVSWQATGVQWSGTNTPATLLPSTVTNNGSKQPVFFCPNSIPAFSKTHITTFKCTIKDSSSTIDSVNFTIKNRSGADLS